MRASAPEPSSLILSVPPQFSDQSALSIDGVLARRELLIPPELPHLEFYRSPHKYRCKNHGR